MIHKLSFLLFLITLLTACNFFDPSSDSENEQVPKKLVDFVDIDTDDDLTIVGLGDSVTVSIKPKKKLRIKAEVKGFSILIGNMDINSASFSNDIYQDEEWEFVAKDAEDYEIKITIQDEDEVSEVFFKTF